MGKADAKVWIKSFRKAEIARLMARCVLASALAMVAPGRTQTAENYRLAPNDVLYFAIFGEPDTVTETRIAGDGTGYFPFLKSFHVGGLTLAQASEALREAYIRKEYFVDPQINLGIRTYAKRVFTVLGQVQRPGTYELVGNESISLFGAIGMAGGYTRIANRGSITVRRSEGRKEQLIRLNGRDGARGANGSDFRIQPGDVISVGESMF